METIEIRDGKLVLVNDTGSAATTTFTTIDIAKLFKNSKLSSDPIQACKESSK